MEPINQLYVFTDADCPLCRRVRAWATRQRAFVPLAFYPLQSPGLAQRFPGIDRFDLRGDLTVLAPSGEVWRGFPAWIMVLWALEDWREWALRFAEPEWRPWAKRLVLGLSRRRHRFTAWLGADEAFVDRVRRAEVNCEQTSCRFNPSPEDKTR